MLYINAANHVQISYPRTATPQHSTQQRYLLPKFWSALSDSARKGSELLVNFPFVNIRTKNYSLYATVSIGKSTNPYDVKNCYHVNDCVTSSCKLSNATINGKTFRVLKVESAGMSHYVEGESYRYRLGKTCYATEYLMSGFNQSDGKALNKLKTKYALLMQKMIRSFRLINS